MSYLNALRLHFAGRFQANVSTVNNDPGHFDNASFIPSYQDMQGPRFNPPNGWFNPQGDAAWRLLGCTVTGASLATGPVPGDDPILHCIVADSDSRVPAKLVDLDPEQQLVSEIWGLQVRIADAHGRTLLRSRFEPAAFADIWDRATGSGGGGDIGAGAMYQSVLTDLEWGDCSHSKFLTALKDASKDGLLSIKFNVDGLNMTFTSPDFMCGRIVGTIGPATASEPHHLLLGRQFMATASPRGNFFTPVGGINFCAAVLESNQLFLDLGNALTTNAPGGTLNNLGDLTVTVANAPSGVNPLGTVPASTYSTDADWYARTAGVVVFTLNDAQVQAIESQPLTISGKTGITISEWPTGAFVRADRFVYRLSPGDHVEIPVYATQWGRPLAGTEIAFKADPSQLQPSNNINPDDVPPVATPTDAIRFDNNDTTDKHGRAVLKLKTKDPGTPRYFGPNKTYGIDGQVYGVRPGFSDPQFTGPVNQWNFISILLWSAFETGKPVTWTDIHPVMQQYANLYPVMNRFLDLGNYDDVVKNTGLLQLAFGLHETDPNVMPVTRDLSPAKRKAILEFLARPQRGVVAGEEAVGLESVAAPREVEPEAAVLAAKGGKAAAAARRLVVQKGFAS